MNFYLLFFSVLFTKNVFSFNNNKINYQKTIATNQITPEVENVINKKLRTFMYQPSTNTKRSNNNSRRNNNNNNNNNNKNNSNNNNKSKDGSDTFKNIIKSSLDFLVNKEQDPVK